MNLLSRTDDKLARLDGGLASLRVLDLFAGCGGFSLGFKTAGYEMVGAVERDSAASSTHAANFFDGSFQHGPLDITKLDPWSLKWGEVDVIIGGPPCQTFARIGRAKLNSESRRADEWASRAGLYTDYLQFVKATSPLVILFENVPDILNYKGRNVADDVCQELEELGYVPGMALLNAVFFGVPQLRERLYILAYRRDLRVSHVNWPQYTHKYDLPGGYRDIRTYARRHPRIDTSRLLLAPQHLPSAVTAEAALRDLAVIEAQKELSSGLLDRASQKFERLRRYSRPAECGTYAWLMRNWPDFESPEGVRDHVIRRLPRDFPLFARMLPGDQYPQAYRLALKLLDAEVIRIRKTEGREPDANEITELRKRILPPYDPTKFPNKWRKMEADAPSRTLMAHLSHDGYSHIHYDSCQARTISVREAARLQSFPDGFIFRGSMNDAFRQIGNAVPPLVAYALARKIGEELCLTLPPDFRDC